MAETDDRVVDVDLKRVWLPSSLAAGSGLKLGSRLTARQPSGIRCRQVCGRCMYKNPSTGSRCSRITCQDYRYCYQHLVMVKHLFISPNSRHLRSLNPPLVGKGVYAVSSLASLKKMNKQTRIPTVNKGVIVFHKGDEIDVYGGEMLNEAAFKERYPKDNTVATYTVADEGSKLYTDGLCARTAAANANDPAANIVNYKVNNSDANVRVLLESDHKSFVMQATKAIHQGEELLYEYGANYWGAK